MIQSLIAFLLEIHATTWVSANLLDSEDAGVKVFHQRAKQGEQAKHSKDWAALVEMLGFSSSSSNSWNKPFEATLNP